MPVKRTCPVKGCDNSVGIGKLVCFTCWRLVPRALGRRLYATWNDGDPTDDYVAARAETLAVCEAKRR